MLHGIELCGVLSLYQKGCEDCVSVGGQKLHFRNYSRIETTLCGCKGIVRRSLENLFQKHAESSQKASETLELIATGKHPSGVKATAEELSTARNDLMWQKAQNRESLDEVKRNRRLISKYAENIELLEQYLAKQGV